MNNGFNYESCLEAISMIGADALALHLNPLQEEGNTNFRGLLKRIEALKKKITIPLMVKEVGCEISREVAVKLRESGVDCIDIAGAGGTSWARIESLRANEGYLKGVGDDLSEWGIPTADSILLVKSAVSDIPIIASGGIRTGMDASTVVLMAMHIIGFKGLEAIPYAVKLGVSLQLNNILRDIGEDWKAGRLYLPLDELKDFNLSELDIQSGIVDNRWRAFMRYQIERCRRLYSESLPSISMLAPDGRFAIAAAELYRAILNDIEYNDYDVFHRRAYVNSLGKLRRLPGIWWRSKTLSYQKSVLRSEI